MTLTRVLCDGLTAYWIDIYCSLRLISSDTQFGFYIWRYYIRIEGKDNENKNETTHTCNVLWKYVGNIIKYSLRQLERNFNIIYVHMGWPVHIFWEVRPKESVWLVERDELTFERYLEILNDSPFFSFNKISIVFQFVRVNNNVLESTP